MDYEYFNNYAIIKISSKTLKKGVFIEEIDGKSVEFSNNYFDLRPNQEVSIRVDYPNLDSKPKFIVKSF